MSGVVIVILLVLAIALFLRVIIQDKPELKQWAIFVQAVAGLIGLVWVISAVMVVCQEGVKSRLGEKLNSYQETYE